MSPSQSISSNEAFVAVGSNIEPKKNILKALKLLAESVTIIAVSSFYRSAAFERADQNDFINGIIKILTFYKPRKLKFDVLRKIESRLGRVRTTDKFAERTIDLDLILYDKLIINEPDLILPDENITIYPFVAVPLLELSPALVLPGTQKRLSDIKAALETDILNPERSFTKLLRASFLKQEQTRKYAFKTKTCKSGTKIQQPDFKQSYQV